jgi:ubiquitin carboxyl-terminal hydrolase MINDY-1/2
MSLIQSIASTSTPVHEDISGPSHEHEHEHEPFPSTSVVPATATAVPAAGEPEGELVKKVKSVRWGLKPIHWPPEQPERVLRIVTQNENGPCSFIAICTPKVLKVHYNSLMRYLGNILILRGEIVITPPDRPSVSYEYLSTLLGDYLVNKCSDVDLDSVFSVLPKTQCRPFDDHHVQALLSDPFPQMGWT